MKRTFKYIAVTLFTGVLFIVISFNLLYHPPNVEDNGFKRHFISGLIAEPKTWEIDNTLNRICDITDSVIFFSNAIPGEIYVYDLEFKHFKHLTVPMPPARHLRPLFYTYHYPGKVVIVAGNVPAIFSYSFSERSTKETFFKTTIGKNVMADKDHIYYVGYDRDLSNKILNFHNLKTGELLSNKNALIDSGRINDGALLYDHEQKHLVYMFYTRNMFLTLDTNLKNVFYAHTIDTTTGRDNVEVINIKGKLQSRTTGLTFVNNRLGYAYDGMLFIQSTLRADNESISVFKKNVVIDIYDYAKGKYKGSFYLPSYKSRKLKAFAVHQSQLLALYEGAIFSCRLKL